MIFLIITAAFSAYSADDPDLNQILVRIDKSRAIEQSDFSALMTMVTQDPENGVEKTVVHTFRRDRNDQFLLLIKEPAVQKGQGYLKKGENLWFYDPESRQFTHSSMKENFQDTDAKNSDFSRSTLSEDYSATDWSEGTLGDFDVYILELQGKHNEVTYPYLKIWVTKETSLVLKSEEYSLNKRLMRVSYYPKYIQAGESYIPTRQIHIDKLVEGKQTQITLSDVSLADLPDSVFSKSYIERVNR